MIDHILVEIRRNETNAQCTDEETDCRFLSLHRHMCQEKLLCSLFGRFVDDGACEECLQEREKIKNFLTQVQTLQDAVRVSDHPLLLIDKFVQETLDLFGAKEPYCNRCVADPGDDSICANCIDYKMFKEKQ